MTETPRRLSQAAFEQLIARAVELDTAGSALVDQERARAIAGELGISTDAWDAALREHLMPAAARQPLRARLSPRKRSFGIGLAGIMLGAVSGGLASTLGDGVLVLGAAAILAGVLLAIDGSHGRPDQQVRRELATWWLALPMGVMLGMGAPHPDLVVFAAVSWGGCALLRWVLSKRVPPAATSDATPRPA